MSNMQVGYLAVLSEVEAVDEIVVLAEGEIELANDVGLFVDKAGADKIIAAFADQGVDVPIDFEHATVYRGDMKSQSAPAAGWIKSLQWKPGTGLIAKVEWTDEAAGYIKDKAYKYLSPVVFYDEETRVPYKLHSMALTNKPKTKNQRELLAASARLLEEIVMPEENKVEAPDTKDADAGVVVAQEDAPEGGGGNLIMKLAVVLTKAGQEVEAGNDEAVLNAAIAFIESAAAAPPEGEAPGEEVAAASEILSALGAKDGNEAVLKLKSEFVPRSEVKTMTARIAELENTDKARKIDAEFERLMAANKLNPHDEAQMKVSRDFAESDFDRFVKFMDAQQPVIAAGKAVTPSAKDLPKSREAILAAADRSWRDGGNATGCGHAAWMNGELRERGMALLSATEAENYK